MLKRRSIGISVVLAIAVLGTAIDAAAGLYTISCQTCRSKYGTTGGICSTFCAGGIICDTTEVGVKTGDVVECAAKGSFNDDSVGLLGVLACGNKGSKKHVAAGVNPVAVSSVEGAKTLLGGDIDKNGKAQVLVLALPDLTELDALCKADKPASTDVALDFTPCGSIAGNVVTTSFETEVQVVDPDGSTRGVQYSCSLPPSVPTCDALADALDAGRVVQYTCTSGATFKTSAP